MEPARPQFYPNTLPPAEISKDNLEQILKDLQLAIKNSVDIIKRNCQPPTDPSTYGNFYGGLPGIILTLLRLERQKSCLQPKGDNPSHAYHEIAFNLIIEGPKADIEIMDGRMSPFASALGPAFMRILTSCEDFNLQLGKGFTNSTSDFTLLNKAVESATHHGHVISFKGYKLGGDEVLFGRAGLLWALLTIQNHCLTKNAKKLVMMHLEPALQCVPKLVEAIISAGKQGSKDFAKLYGPEDALPLMWQWMEGYYALGAVHGTTGILTMLLSCPLDNDQLQLIADTVTGLCRICIKQEGHLPMSIPERPGDPSRRSPFVQLCHGAPGLLILLGVVYQNGSLLERFWRPEWDLALRLATDKVWHEGILSKGGSLCHGLTGNAWPLLPLHNIFEYNAGFQQQAKQARMAALEKSEGNLPALLTLKNEPLNGDFFLSRALPFMMLARETLPYSQEVDNIKPSLDFRVPDRPYCFGEGLAGQMCAWAETCVVIKARLRKMELESHNNGSSLNQDAQFNESLLQQLGFFGLVVNGPNVNQLSLFNGSLCQKED
jgi:hypothetical protein